MTPIPASDAPAFDAPASDEPAFGAAAPRAAARRPRRPAPPAALALALLLALLGACAPSTGTAGPQPADPAAPAEADTADPAFETPQALRIEAAAEEAFHRMEIGRLRTGAYDTGPLVDLDPALPQGARWTVVEFSGDSYTLRFTSDALPGLAWEVSPDGVRRVRA